MLLKQYFISLWSSSPIHLTVHGSGRMIIKFYVFCLIQFIESSVWLCNCGFGNAYSTRISCRINLLFILRLYRVSWFDSICTWYASKNNFASFNLQNERLKPAINYTLLVVFLICAFRSHINLYLMRERLFLFRPSWVYVLKSGSKWFGAEGKEDHRQKSTVISHNGIVLLHDIPRPLNTNSFCFLFHSLALSLSISICLSQLRTNLPWETLKVHLNLTKDSMSISLL